MTKLATIFMIPGGPKWCRDHGIGEIAEDWLAEMNVTLGNSGLVSPDDAIKFPNAKHIIPIFGYPESWRDAGATYEEWLGAFIEAEKEMNDVYLYNCGDSEHLRCGKCGKRDYPPYQHRSGDQCECGGTWHFIPAWLALDEPWTRGEQSLHEQIFNWGRLVEHLNFALNFMPSTKPVVTHPRAGIKTHNSAVPRLCYQFDTDIVHAFDTHVIEMAIAQALEKWPDASKQWRTVLDIPADAEVWAYNALYEGDDNFVDPYRAGWMSEYTPTPQHNAEDMGPWLRERGISTYLHNTSLKYLIDETATDPREMLLPNATDLLNGMVNA